MDHNELVATMIPMYQKFLSSKISEQEIAAAKLRPTADKKEADPADKSALEIDADIDELPAEISDESEPEITSETGSESAEDDDDFGDDFDDFEIEQSDDEEGDIESSFKG